MSPPAWLIAGREFRAYVATASFWVALLVGPLVTAGGLLLMAHQPTQAPPQTLTLSPAQGGAVEARFSAGFPASAPEQARIVRLIAQDSALQGRLHLVATPARPPLDAAAISRFAVMMMLWMTLAGSLGMLLQATVRERANRALESLLAAASPWDIVSGKLIGIGGVSLLVVAAWLGSTAVAALIASRSGGMAGALVRQLAEPAALLRATGIYVITFAFYGLTTVAIGARARDSADAQNLARPMFAVLLAVFFAALVSAGGGASGLGWLVYAPPFTPFLLLLHPQPLLIEIATLAGLAAASLVAGWMAVQAVTLDPSPRRRLWPKPA